MLQPSQRLSKIIATRFKPAEYEHVFNFIQIAGFKNLRDFILANSGYQLKNKESK